MKQHNTPGFVEMRHGSVISQYLAPAQILVGGFLMVIIIGTVLLMLPISSSKGETTQWITALFTATSAVCVTGLSVVNTLTHWSTFGKVVILLCIQIGGLGFMSLVSMIFILTGKKISLKNRLLMQEALNYNTTAGIVRFTKYMVKATFLVEGIGAFLLAFAFVPQYGLIKGIWYAVFHAISAFCNAGFDLIGNDSLMPYVGSTLVNLTIMGLIIISGLGFGVWLNTYQSIKCKFDRHKPCTWRQVVLKMSVHTRLVWIMTLVLLVFGFLFFFCSEYTNPGTLGGLTLKEKIYAAMFQSVTPRTAGFYTLALDQLKPGSKVMTMLLMFIGGSPGGTSGGVKTVTIGILILCALSTIKGDENTVIFKRKIPRQLIARALTLIMISMTMILTTLIILTFTEKMDMLDLLFETISAYGTVGITLGITSKLSIIGKLIMIVAMFIGRLGPITIAVALMLKQNHTKAGIDYPEEKVMIG